MTLIRIVLVPFWRRLPPSEFRAWFRAHGKRVGSVMIPLGVGAAVAGVGGAMIDRDRGSKLAAAAVATVVGITVAVNEPANERFWSDDIMSDEDTVRLLERWSRWHDARTVLGILAAVAAARRLARSSAS